MVFFCSLLASAHAEDYFCSPPANAIFQKACPEIFRAHPDFEVENSDIGDLDGDGIADVVYVVSRRPSGEYVIGVMHGLKDGRFAPWAQTQMLSPVQRVPEVLVKKGSFYVSLFRNTPSDGDTTEVQYRWRNGNFFKIGMEEDFQSPLHEDMPGPRHSWHESTNYLTRIQIHASKNEGEVSTSRRKLPAAALEKFEEYGGQ